MNEVLVIHDVDELHEVGFGGPVPIDLPKRDSRVSIERIRYCYRKMRYKLYV